MSTLYLLKDFNNYFNNIKTAPKTLAEYMEYTYVTINNCNISVKDGVDTKHVVNMTEQWTPDYCVVTDGTSNITSRWFVLEGNRTMGAQYELTLHRDVIADAYDIIKSAPCYIEKATLPIDSPLIYNDEGMSFNQIKKSETPIGTDVGWIVGYVSKDAGQLSWNVSPEGSYIDIYSTLDNWQYYIAPGNHYNSQIKYASYMWMYGVVNHANRTTLSINNDGAMHRGTATGNTVMMANYDDMAYNALKAKVEAYGAGALNTIVNNQISAHNDIETMLSYNGKIIRTSDNKLYKVTFTSTGRTISGESTGNLLSAQQSIAVSANVFTNTDRTASYRSSYRYDEYIGSYEEQTVDAYSGTTSTSRWKCIDSPLYDMFAIPYGPIMVYGERATSKDVSIQIASSIAASSSAKCYDLQLLPYCPIQEYKLVDYNTLVLDPDDANKGWQKVYINNVFKTVILYPSKCNQSLSIYQPIPTVTSSAIDKKIANECDIYRLCSPNGAGQFDFSVVKNNGVDYYDVDITYKPYNPYLHIAPHFGGLYGADFNDFRGLNCNGDFSFGTLNDAFATYELQNKNYQNIFNREIESMTKQHRLDMTSSAFQAVTGVAGAAAMGSRLGAGWGVGMGVASAVGGIADLGIKQASYKEQLSLKSDLYNYQLGNIKALPYSIAKTSAMCANNKILPYLEYYTCTDEEKELLRDKLKYTGMYVSVISTISDFLEQGELTYIKGQIIRLDGLGEDSHFADAIYDEILKGVYI